MAGRRWDPVQGRCVPGDGQELQSLALRRWEDRPEPAPHVAAEMFLIAMRQQASADAAQFNALMLHPDYRARFFASYPDGRIDGLADAAAEILQEIDSVLAAVSRLADAIANDSDLATQLVAATGAMYMAPLLKLSDAERAKLEAKLNALQKRLGSAAGGADQAGSLPFAGLRDDARRIMGAFNTLRVWRNAIAAPSQATLGFAAADALFQEGHDWSNIGVGTEDEATTLFAVTAEAIVGLNCDPAGQGYNLGWIVGYMALWIATIVCFEGIIAMEAPL